MDANLITTAEGNAQHGIVYPRHVELLERFGGTKRAMEQVKHPTKNEIVATIKRALQDAKSELNKLGVLVDSPDKECFKYDPRLAPTSSHSASEDITGPQVDDCDDTESESVGESQQDDADNAMDERDRQDIEILNLLFDADLPDFSHRLSAAQTKNGTVDPFSIALESTQFVRIPDKNKKLRIVKKSAIVWFLECGVRRLSNDRTYRVRATSPYIQRQHLIVKSVKKTVVRIGDWAIFETEEDCPLQNLFFLGRVLSFSILTGNKKELEKRVWEWDPDGEEANVGALCIWYEVEWDLVKKEFKSEIKDISVSTHGFHPCETYVCSIPPPTVDPDSFVLRLSNDVVSDLLPFLKDLIL